GSVVVTAGVGEQRTMAEGGVGFSTHAQVASILTKKGVVRTEVVHEEFGAFVEVANGVRGSRERQVAEDVIRARRALRASIPLRPLRAFWPCWPLCSLWPGSTRSTRGT